MNFLKKAAFPVLLVLLAIGAQPSIAAYWQWSKTPATNATADQTINWAEGMSPSSVNDSARAMMARMAEQRDDISGLLATAGGPTAFTVTTNQGLQTPLPVDGQSISVTMNATNGANATLAVDGGTALPIQSSAGVAVPDSTMIAGSPYKLKYSSANSAWMLFNFYSSPTTVPLGGLIAYTLTTTPNSNFVFAAGQCLSTTTYSVYWVALGSPAPGTCAAGQFRIIDTSGNVVAGLDTMPGFSAANRLTSVSTGCGTVMTTVGTQCANGRQNHTNTIAEMPSHYHTASIYDPGHSHTYSYNAYNGAVYQFGSGYAYFNAGTYSTGSSVTGVRVNSSNGLDTTYSTGGGGAHNITQPTVGATYILRVL